MTELGLDETGKYVAGAYVLFVALLLVYLAIMAARLSRIDEEIEALTEQLPDTSSASRPGAREQMPDTSSASRPGAREQMPDTSSASRPGVSGSGSERSGGGGSDG